MQDKFDRKFVLDFIKLFTSSAPQQSKDM